MGKHSELPPGLARRGNAIHIDTSVDGRHLRRSCKTTSVPEAHRLLDTLRGQIRIGTLTGIPAHILKPKTSLEGFIEQEFARLQVDGSSPRTLAKYRGVMAHLRPLRPPAGAGDALPERHRPWHGAVLCGALGIPVHRWCWIGSRIMRTIEACLRANHITCERGQVSLTTEASSDTIATCLLDIASNPAVVLETYFDSLVGSDDPQVKAVLISALANNLTLNHLLIMP
jgi:hypothetical protein